MIKIICKRLLPLLLATLMVVSALPLHVLAEEIITNTTDTEHDHEHEHEDETVSATPSADAKDMANRINTILNTYAVTSDMSDAEIKAAINAQPWSVNKPIISEIALIEAMTEELSSVDAVYVVQNSDVETFIRFKNIFKPMFAVVKATSGTYTPVTGVTVSVSGATNTTNSSGTITVTAKGSGGIFGIGASAKTATITISNDSGNKAKVSFDWTTTSAFSLKIDGVSYSGSTSGSFEKVIESGSNIQITLTTDKNNTENKVVMKNFALTAVKESSNVTFEYDSNFGSITVAGNATATGTAMDIPSAGAELVATAQNGGTFLAWVNAETHMILSKSATYKLEPADDMTVKAVFTQNACFVVDGNLLYEDLNAALNAVASASSKTVVLANSGILPAGNYTIPSGVTLLIPYDDANTLCTTAPTTTEATFSAPTVYRKMTMASGANITVNGAISLSATQTASGGLSSPVGACSFIQMDADSSITVNNGGKLYAWGYITGSGSVTVENGGTVYECFQVMDWRGGDNTSGMIDNSYRVFPMSQYYIQNIEVPMTLKAGATEKGYMSINITLVGIQGAAVPFVGSDGMFQIVSGHIVKDYDESTGRLLIDVYGDLSVKSLSISMKLSLLGTKTINSSKYVLPINGNMTINMHSGGVTMTQDIALQPGARLIVGKDATCTLGSGNKIYVYDYDQWTTEGPYDEGEGPSFCGTPDDTHINLKYPASATTVQGRDQDAYVEVNGMADLSAGYVYTTAGGANVRGAGTIIMRPGTETVTYQIKNTGSDNKTDKWFSIPITSGKLQNADGTFVETADDKGVVIYKSIDGVWTCEHTYANGTYTETTTNATCLEDGVKTTTCNCGEDFKTAVLEATGHDIHSHDAKAPTCTEIGWYAYEACSRCDYTTYEERAALGHTPGAEATCETNQTCTVCGEELKAALGHKPGADATCETNQICTVCDKELNASLGHNWEWIVDEEATVLVSGIKHEECSTCHTTRNENTVIPVLTCSHEGSMVGTEAKTETCTDSGNSAYWYCTACHKYYLDESGQNQIEEGSWIIAALGHNITSHNAKNPTCTEIGWNAYEECSRCDYTTYEEKEELGHDITKYAAKASTCVESGWDAYEACSRCDYNTKVEKPIDPKAHAWDEGKPYKNHSCNSNGSMAYKCNLCDAENIVVTELQHFRVPIGEEIPATCTKDGITSGWKCEKCHEFWIPQEVIPALGHDWNGVYPCQSASSACAREGCDLHFDTQQDHLVVIDHAVDATCTSTGLTAGSHCGYCGEVLVAQTVTSKIDHVFIVADMEIAARCGIVGHKEGASYCMYCEYDADPIPALEHSWMHRDSKKPTYTVVGWNEHDYCILCNAIKTLEEYEDHPCEFCGDEPEGYMETPMLEIQRNSTLEDFLVNLEYLEQMAEVYALQHPGTDPLALVLNYMRTAVDNYTTGSWAIMAGPEDKDFFKFVQEMEDTINNDPNLNVWINVSGLKKLASYKNTHGEKNEYTNGTVGIMSGHFFGTMDMTYHNLGSTNHADVGGWVGDLTDLLSLSDEFGVPANLTFEEKVAYIKDNYLFKNDVAGSAGSFGSSDLYADLEAFYFMNEIITNGYETGDLVKMMREYYVSGLTLKTRVEYLLNNRLYGLSTRQDLRTAVYNIYTGNKLIATLEGTRNFNTSGNELAELRKAVCYAFADEMCRIAGDYVEDLTNDRFTIFDTETTILAPGISQQISYATNADGKQIVFYIATADVSRDDVGVWVNYYDRDPGTPDNPAWKNTSVLTSAQNAQDRYGNPNSPDYIENFNVIASTNAGGYDMSDVATPGGLMVMNGVEWHPQSGTAGFFAILADGTAYMGTHEEYESMMSAGLIKEAIGGFGEFVVKNGEVVGSTTYSDAPRTSVGITATGRVVLMCIDGRQAPFSSGASLQDVGYIMKEAGCVVAINLDGGGSTTFVARQPGDEELTIMNRPSDGYPRNVSTNLLIYSTAPSSTTFDHAIIESEYDYSTIGTPVQLSAVGVSPSGSAVDVPEGAYWVVANEDMASITENGVFIGKRLGEVNVYLMLDGVNIGTKRMTIATPDQLYFERNKVDAIYGSEVKLPLRARIEGKAIAINANDVTFVLSASGAGYMDGFTFKTVESTVKTLVITAHIGEEITAAISVMLYKQGENSFDFETATGGDRMLAWYREVTNSMLEDGNIYNVIDPTKDMVTSYIFAMDMTTIPIPERLSELSYMLPGGTIEGATAWSFLLSLAQRISDMSWVKATIKFDERFVVDYSELVILNEYFTMKDLTFDETTNTLTVTMGWIKQSHVIDEATANPLCLIKGIKLTPKDGVWTEDLTKINAVMTGTIGYQIYMRASGLYGFAQKPENQAVFGLYPYRNPNDTSEAGAYFSDTYASITDEYTLVNVLKEGWVNEDGGFAYYVNGVRYTGVQKVDGYYYDFGENGINAGQTKFTGLFFDESVNAYRYAYIGSLTSGWQMINNEWYYFDTTTMKAVVGKKTISHVPYEFEETGRLVSGVWMNVFVGYRYYYGPDYVRKGWYEINGDWYYFKDAFALTGDQRVASQEISTTKLWYHFDENGVSQGKLTGIVENNGKLYYVENGKETEKGLFVFNGDYYCTIYDGSLVVNQKYYAWLIDSSSTLPKGHYTFGPDGKMVGGSVDEETGGISGIVEVDGKLYYYENGKPTEKGLFKYNGEYYFNHYNGELVVNDKYYAWKLDATADLPKGHYEFGPDGRMLNGIIDKNGNLYYYENGQPKEKGLFNYNGDYYFSIYDGSLVVGQKYYVWKHDVTSNFVNGHYHFGPDGKMCQGIVAQNGVLYYYENGKTVDKGLFLYSDGYHYFAEANGALITSKSFYAWKVDETSLLSKATYEFDTEGRVVGSSLTGEIVNKNGVLYYYEAGHPTEKGLFKFNGYYYVSQYDGKLITGQKYYVWKHDVTSDLKNDHYEFDAEGKMLQGIVEKNGKLYYYENGKPTEKGLFKYNGDYYFTHYDGEMVVGQKYYVWKHDVTSNFTNGHYEFDSEGKMVQGIYEKNGKLYYYEDGKPVEKGLFMYNGDYYFTHYDGELVVNQKYYAWKIDETSELPKGHYWFDENGKLVGASKTGEIVEINGKLYYYECGQPIEKGVFMMDGYYYYAQYDGSLIVNCKYYVWRDNEYLMVNHYTFNEFGQIIG